MLEWGTGAETREGTTGMEHKGKTSMGQKEGQGWGRRGPYVGAGGEDRDDRGGARDRDGAGRTGMGQEGATAMK